MVVAGARAISSHDGTKTDEGCARMIEKAARIMPAGVRAVAGTCEFGLPGGGERLL